MRTAHTLALPDALAFARATDDLNASYTAGRCVPPVAVVGAPWPALRDVAGRAPAFADGIAFHLAHDVHYGRAILPGESLVTECVHFGERAGVFGREVTYRLVLRDASRSVVVDQYATVFVPGPAAARRIGSARPSHRFRATPPGSRPLATIEVDVPADQSFRYAEASGDRTPIHVSDDAARRAGLRGVIVHGMCTMAICHRELVRALAGGDPERTRRLAARFAQPLYPGTRLAISVQEVGRTNGTVSYGFEATSGGRSVIRVGRLDLAFDGGRAVQTRSTAR